MTTIATASETAVSRAGQAGADFAEYQRLYSEALDLERNTLRMAKEKEAAACKKWSQPIIHAVLCANEQVYNGRAEEPSFCDFSQVVRNNQEAMNAVEEILQHASMGKKEDISMAFGLGMVAGMMYSQLTGMTLTVPDLPKEESAVACAPTVTDGRQPLD
jgi:hypothetical protein